MDYQELINKIKPDLDRTSEYFKGELSKLRVGRATPAMVEDLEVECYGSRMPIKQLANITAPQPRLIIIQPWDKSILEDIKKAISQSSLGVSPVIDGEVIRVNIPPLSEERREELVKILRDRMEEARISIRHKREEAWKEVQESERAGEIPEDDKFKAKDKLQDLVDEYNKKIEEIGKKKEGEIMRV